MNDATTEGCAMSPWCPGAHGLALILAALAPVLIEACLIRCERPLTPFIPLILSIVFVIALCHALLLGFPLFMVLAISAKPLVNAASSILCGFIIGIGPLGMLAVAGWQYITAMPMLEAAELLFHCGALGAAGGFMFWLTLKLTGCLCSGVEPIPTADAKSGARK